MSDRSNALLECMDGQRKALRERTVARDAYQWAALAVGSLVVAGLLSLFVVLGRLPVLSRLIDDPLFFKRCLVTHVNLSLTVWFGSFIAALSALRHRERSSGIGQSGFALAALGAFGIVVGSLVRGAEPILSNYVPVIDHPVFLGGLALFFAGLGLFLGENLLRPGPASGPLPAEAGIGLQAAAALFFVAAATFVGAWSSLPEGVGATIYYELLFWGPGHGLQVANVCAMLAVWLWLARKALGTPVVSPRWALALFAALALPHFALPLLTAQGAEDALYTRGATMLMRWGIFPIVSIFLLLIFRAWRGRGAHCSPLQRMAWAAFLASAGLTVFGFALGACIRSSTTLVPAHYHASLGAVTLSFMAGLYLLAAAAEGSSLPRKLGGSARWQLLAYGSGQVLFALGFGLGGLYGLGRKAYASEQAISGVGATFALVVMGIGGLVAVTGGVWFLALAIARLKAGLGNQRSVDLDGFSATQTQCMQ